MAAPKKETLAQNWGKQSTTTKIGVLILMIFAVGGGYYQFVIKDLRAEKSSKEKDQQSLLSLQAGLNQRIDALDKLRQKRDALEGSVSGIELALPADAELNSFLNMLQQRAGEASVSFKNWKREKEQKVGKYSKVPVTITVSGTFYQLLKYFYLLGPEVKNEAESSAGAEPGETEAYDRLMTVENLVLTGGRARADEVMLTAKFRAVTFRQPGAKIAEVPETPTGGGAAAGKDGKPLPKVNSASQPGNAANSMIKDTDAARKKREADVKASTEEAGAN